jgi:uncharacterized protein (TIGR02145 family)
MKNYFKKLTLLLAVTLVFIVSCSKDDGEKSPVVHTTPVLKDNVKIIDAANLQLDLTQTQLDAGIYQFTATGTIPAIAVGDVIVGDQGEGFLRKVTSVLVNGSTITMQTTQGSMTDVFKEGGFDFNLDMTDMQNRTSSSGFSYTIPSQPIYQEGALSIELNNGQVDFNPNWFFDFNFDETGIKDFEVSAKNATLNGNFTATITAAQSVTLIDRSSSILPNARPYKKTFTIKVRALIPVGPILVPVTVPIKVVMELDLVLDYSASISAAITRQAKFTSNNTFNLGVNYANEQWNDINSFSPINNFSLLQRTGNANATINLALTPKVSFKLYGAIGPYAQVGLIEELSGSFASPALDWNFKADVWLKSKVGINDVSILGYNLQGYSKSWETEKLSYLTPYKIEKVSGDNQTGNFGQPLTAPIKVKVLDNLGRIQSNVPVYFLVVEGGGTVQSVSILTDNNGFAETQWTLGTSGLQRLNVSAITADGTAILNAPLSFSATATASPCDDTTAPYPTVTIGSQVWMKKNLNVCKYRNGDDIPQVQDPAAWANLTTGAWCYYENNTSNGPVYGKLYNWYAVNDPRGLAPNGYHLANKNEYSTLITYLGGFDLAGGKMKATYLWNSPNTGATNSSGFTGLPGGYRGADGVFNSTGLGYSCYLWTSTEDSTDPLRAFDTGLSYNYNRISLFAPDRKGFGFSVRCLKD